jgi:hypothetical protein
MEKEEVSIYNLEVKRDEAVKSGELYTGRDNIITRNNNYDSILDEVRMQWLFGDWNSLVTIDPKSIEGIPDRANIAVLVGSAHSHLGNRDKAQRFLRMAKAWGVQRRSLARILISDVHNSLACSAVLVDDWPRAMSHFRESVKGISGDERLACQARIVRELVRLDLLARAGRVLKEGIGEVHSIRAEQRELKLIEIFEASVDHSSSLITAESPVSEAVRACLKAEDIHQCIDTYLADETVLETEKFEFCLEVSDQFYDQGDELTGLNFLRKGSKYISEIQFIAGQQKIILAKKLTERKRDTDALDLVIKESIHSVSFNKDQQTRLVRAYNKIWQNYSTEKEHGHQLLIDFIDAQTFKTQFPEKMIIIEIGSTREDIPGQGSTEQIAECAQRHNLHFITVDIDPHNTIMAKESIHQINSTFEAITEKGEDFLRRYDNHVDYVFLDAYDFDHGKHSKLRQSRYQKYLGEAINDEACHKMHLDCAESLGKKLSANGVICIDDTWQNDSGSWTAKGTLAVPYLLNNGFEVIESRNRAVLLKRR